MKDVQSVLYSVESLEKMGEAIGAFYKKLIEAGIPDEQAAMLTMTQQHRLNDVTDGRRLHIRPPRPARPARPAPWATRITHDGEGMIIRTTSEPIDDTE